MAIFDQAAKTQRFGFRFAPLLLGLALGAPATIVRAEATDPDLDRVQQAVDNCPFHSNAPQRDTDKDGHGNRCDPDLDNNGVVGISDFVIASAAYGSNESDPRWNPHADIDGDGVVGAFDATFVQAHVTIAMPLGADSAGVGLVVLIEAAFGSKRGDENYDRGADLTGDGVVGTPDFVRASKLQPARAATSACTEPGPGRPVVSGLADLPDNSGDGVVGIPKSVIEPQQAAGAPVTSAAPAGDPTSHGMVGVPDFTLQGQQTQGYQPSQPPYPTPDTSVGSFMIGEWPRSDSFLFDDTSLMCRGWTTSREASQCFVSEPTDPADAE